MFFNKSIFFNMLLAVYLYFLLGFSWWASALIVTIFACTPICVLLGAILEKLIIIISIAMHVYTSIFAFSHNWVKGIFTLVLPGISEIYWFIADGCENGFNNSLFCTISLWYVLGLVIVFIMPHFTDWNKPPRLS